MKSNMTLFFHNIQSSFNRILIAQLSKIIYFHINYRRCNFAILRAMILLIQRTLYCIIIQWGYTPENSNFFTQNLLKKWTLFNKFYDLILYIIRNKSLSYISPKCLISPILAPYGEITLKSIKIRPWRLY